MDSLAAESGGVRAAAVPVKKPKIVFS